MEIEIILTGSFGVGKSSIFNRFIHNEFSNKYYGTLGVRVNVKTIEVEKTSFNIKIWDIAGEVSQTKVPKSYFHSPDIIMYVVDLSRTFGFKKIPEDLVYLKEIAPEKRIIVVGNKTDLLVKSNHEAIKEKYPEISFDWLISARTGENIEELFNSIALEQKSISK